MDFNREIILTKTTNTMTRVKYEVFVKIPAFETKGLGIYESNGLLIFDWGTKRCTSIGGGGPFLIDLCETKSDAKETIDRFKSSFYNLLGNSSFKVSSRTFNTF